MTTRRILLLCSLLALSLTGCQKDSETVAPGSPTKTSLLTADAWHITAYTRTTGGGSASNYLPTAFPRSCEQDDRYTFKTNGVEERAEGPTSCSGSSGSQAVVGTYPWNFNADQSQITIGGTTFTVVTLTADAMQLRSSRTSNGQTIVDNVTYAN